jgi:AMMECR1 domain-containing protein
VEVSVLSPPVPFPVRDEADACARLQPGVDGLILAWRGRRATFLPQVWQQLPNPIDFLTP